MLNQHDQYLLAMLRNKLLIDQALNWDIGKDWIPSTNVCHSLPIRPLPSANGWKTHSGRLSFESVDVYRCHIKQISHQTINLIRRWSHIRSPDITPTPPWRYWPTSYLPLKFDELVTNPLLDWVLEGFIGFNGITNFLYFFRITGLPFKIAVICSVVRV